jgi:hypothetical protein
MKTLEQQIASTIETRIIAIVEEQINEAVAAFEQVLRAKVNSGLVRGLVESVQLISNANGLSEMPEITIILKP